MQYQEAVAEARQLVKRSEEDQWRLAQLTYEQVRQGGITRQRWADDVGIKSLRYVSSLATVWERYGGQHLPSRPSFPDAIGIVHTPHRYEEGEGSSEVGRAKSTVRNMPPEDKAAVARELLDDEDVAVRTLRDPHTRRNVTDAREQVTHEIETAARDRTEADPTSRAIREATLELNIESNISKARFWLAESARQVQELEDRDPAVMSRLGVAADEAGVALGWLQTAIEGGQVSDEELARLLDEGGA
jgi:hypothetical protein